MRRLHHLICAAYSSYATIYGALGLFANTAPNRMGELEPWIDENFVRSVWYNLGEQVNVKMIRDKFSGYYQFPALARSVF